MFWDVGLASTNNLIRNYADRPKLLQRCDNCRSANDLLDRQPGGIWFEGAVLPLDDPGFTPPRDQALNVQYLCKVKQLKQPANLVQSVLVATFSLFVSSKINAADARARTGHSTAPRGCCGARTLARSATSACSMASPRRPRLPAPSGTGPSSSPARRARAGTPPTPTHSRQGTSSSRRCRRCRTQDETTVCPGPLRRQVVKDKVNYSDRRDASTCIGLVKFQRYQHLSSCH